MNVLEKLFPKKSAHVTEEDGSAVQHKTKEQLEYEVTNRLHVMREHEAHGGHGGTYHKFEKHLGPQEYAEEGVFQWKYTGYPQPINRYHLFLEDEEHNIEEMYFWIFRFLTLEWQFSEQDVIKVKDIYAATEHSAFFGNAQQRLGIQQDKVSQFLATVGKMTKELFQLVREIRIIKERLEFYNRSEGLTNEGKPWKGDTRLQYDKSSDITLKGIWVDLVEGGGKNPSSVYGMAQQVGFAILPDIFFDTYVRLSEEEKKGVDGIVDALNFNKKVKEVLKRKLRSYLTWKRHTYDELKHKLIFTVKYLRQHYEIIQMYLNWVRPYLKNIKKLRQGMDTDHHATLISAFEGSLLEIEILFRGMPRDPDGRKPSGFSVTSRDAFALNKRIQSIIIASFEYISTPHMLFVKEGYQKGPVHSGHTHIYLRCYTWTEEQIQKYLEMRREEDLELLEYLDPTFSVKAAMDSLGTEINDYLKQAGKEIIEFDDGTTKEAPKQPSMLDPFLSIFSGVGEIFGAFAGSKGGKKSSKDDEKKRKEREEDASYAFVNKEHGKYEAEIKRAFKTVRQATFVCYKNFRKAHEMITW